MKIEVLIDETMEDRNGRQKPRQIPESKRVDNKSKKQDEELDNIINLSAMLRELRVTHEFTQADIAKRTGINQQIVSRIDRNDLNPRLSTFKKYLSACGIDLESLIAGELNRIKNQNV